MTKVDGRRVDHLEPSDPELTRRALAHVHAGTTDLAPSVLRVPLSYYRDPDMLRREHELLTRTPIAVVPSARVKHEHDYVVRELLGTSVLVARAADGVARGFLNYCRHRGARPAAGCGNTRRFTCPYHAWVYDTRGQLVGIPGARGFVNVDRNATGLVELPCEERHGLVWVVLTAGADLDLDAHLGPVDAELAVWSLADYEHYVYREFESEVSWKAALEAFAESYHFPYVHANSIIGKNTIADIALHEAFGRHHRLCFPEAWITAHDTGDTSWDPIDNVAIIYWLFPNLVLALSPVGVELIDILPAGSPTRCTVRHEWMAKTPVTTEQQRAGYDELFRQVHAALRDEDFGMLPQCGDGIRNAQHDHMLIGRNEIGVQHVVRALAGALGVGALLSEVDAPQ
jgi:nitrite reductase/ring-hydroxylating ferredoxin subunit